MKGLHCVRIERNQMLRTRHQTRGAKKREKLEGSSALHRCRVFPFVSSHYAGCFEVALKTVRFNFESIEYPFLQFSCQVKDKK